MTNYKESCDKVVENFSYFKKFTPAEMDEMKDNLADKSIELNALQEEFDEVKSLHKDKTKPIKKAISGLLTNIKAKGQTIVEEVYQINIQEENRAYFYNQAGEEVFSRPLKADEKQKTLFSIERESKTGTND
jgi:hypothetical protein